MTGGLNACAATINELLEGLAPIDIDVEFALQVKQYTEPPELIRACLGHRKRDPKLAQTLLDGILEPIT